MSEVSSSLSPQEAHLCTTCTLYRQENLLKDALIERLQCLIDELRTTENNLMSETVHESSQQYCQKHNMKGVSPDSIDHSMFSAQQTYKEKVNELTEQSTAELGNKTVGEYHILREEFSTLQKTLETVEEKYSLLTTESEQKNAHIQELTETLNLITTHNSHLIGLVDSACSILQEGLMNSKQGMEMNGHDLLSLSKYFVSQLLLTENRKASLEDKEVQVVADSVVEEKTTQTDEWTDDVLVKLSELERTLLDHQNLLVEFQNEENHCKEKMKLLLSRAWNFCGHLSTNLCEKASPSELLHQIGSTYSEILNFCDTFRQQEDQLVQFLVSFASSYSVDLQNLENFSRFHGDRIVTLFDAITRLFLSLKSTISSEKSEIERLLLVIKEMESSIALASSNCQVEKMFPEYHLPVVAVENSQTSTEPLHQSRQDWCGGPEEDDFEQRDIGMKRLRKEMKRVLFLYKKEQDKVISFENELESLRSQIREIVCFLSDWGISEMPLANLSSDNAVDCLRKIRNQMSAQLLLASQEKEAFLLTKAQEVDMTLNQVEANQKANWFSLVRKLRLLCDSPSLQEQYSDERLLSLSLDELFQQFGSFLIELIDDLRNEKLNFLTQCNSLQVELSHLYDRVNELENTEKRILQQNIERLEGLQSQYVQTDSFVDPEIVIANRNLKVKYEKALKRLKSVEDVNMSLKTRVSFLETECDNITTVNANFFSTLLNTLSDSYACDLSCVDKESFQKVTTHLIDRIHKLLLERDHLYANRKCLEKDVYYLIDHVEMIQDYFVEEDASSSIISKTYLHKIQEIVKELFNSVPETSLIRTLQQHIQRLIEVHCRLLHDMLTSREAILAFSDEDNSSEALSVLLSKALNKMVCKPSEKYQLQLQELEVKAFSIRKGLQKLNSLSGSSLDRLTPTVNNCETEVFSEPSDEVRMAPKLHSKTAATVALLKEVQELLISAQHEKDDIQHSHSLVQNLLHNSFPRPSTIVATNSQTSSPRIQPISNGIHLSDFPSSVAPQKASQVKSSLCDNPSDTSFSSLFDRQSSIHPV